MPNSWQDETATALVERARSGDPTAFDELVRRYRDRVVALALHLTGSATEAEDIAQEVFLKAYLKLGQFEGRSHFFTWVYRMAINRSLNARRNRFRRRETSITDGDPRVELALTVDVRDNPARAAELRQTYALLLGELDQLPPAMCTTVVLVVLQGLSHEEAAVVEQCSPGTIAWRIHQARKRLRAAIEGRTGCDRLAVNKRSLSPKLASLLTEWLSPLPGTISV
jgi:RNA polymerase sigma-70 factor (ECF subfamily)